QQVILSQSATIQSLSYYVSTAGGQLRLGIYNNNGSNPGTLVAETAAFTPVVGWNTQPVLTPTLLPAGTYWLAFLPQSNTLTGRITFSGTGRYYGYTFGALPATFSTSPSSAAFHFSVYATLTTALPTATPTATSTSAINCAVVNGTGSATLFQPYRQYNCERYAYAVGIADFNNDGDKDVALSVRTGTTGSPSSLLVFHQDNNGNLSQPLIYSGGNRAEHMAVGDVNNDGLDDVVTVDFSDNTISLFSQTGAGELAERVTYATNSGPDAIAIGDVNNDGLNDVAVAHHTSAMIGVFIQKADGTLDAMTTYPSVSAGFDDIAIGDVNGDGLNDVVKMNGQGLNSNIMVYRQNANGSLNTSLNYSIAACTSTCLSNGIAIGDVTEDGRLDVILSYGGNRPNSNIAVFEQGVNGDLQPSVSYPAYDTPGAIEVADVNSDGLEDVVVVHEVWLQAGVFLQQNDGTLGIETLYPVPNSNAEDLDIGDINGDQLPDLAIADSAGLIVLYRNANPPSPTYTPSSTFTPTVTNTPTRTSAPTATATLSATITLGETTILSANYSGMGNRLAAQQVTLSQSATIQSLSYYVSTAGGQLRLGIYNNNGSNPGTLVAETAAFTPVAGWNTQPVLTPVLLPAGTYWLAFLPQNNSLAGRVTAAGVGRYYSYTFGSMPSSYSTSPTTGVFRFSFYATLSTVTASPTVTLTPTPTLCFDC
ncbi:MAG: VCBS repeat-containing protein, partial [Anaerolineales bacterium]|nr:VCBS repeat-containing protein [Anaerolineales bacterium]